ncbi:MAG TPA: hypothetical protein VKQ09_05770 [Sphingomonas sp.]|nr:hypothetical protein [Sphingomonas sp.]
MSGFYLMHRGWQDNAVFRNEEFSRRDAFVWLIEEAAFRPTKIHAGTGEIMLERGQLSHSLRFMAKAWKWDEAKVRRFLSSLVKSQIIDASTDAGQTVITIRNYEVYQTPGGSPDAGDDADATQQRRGGDAKKKEGKEVKNTSEAKASSVQRAQTPHADPFPRPDFADPQHWADFLANRKRKKLPNTATAHARLLSDIARLADEEWPPGRILQHAAERGWAGIYDPRENGNRNGQRPHHEPQQGEFGNPMAAAAARSLARSDRGRELPLD